jgi:protease I
MPKKVLMIVGDFVEDYEAMVPFQMLTMAGHSVHTVCPGKKPGESVKTAIHDFEGDQTYSEKRGHNFAINTDFASVRPEDYDALFLPGGRAPEYLRLNEKVLEVTRYFSESDKPIGTLCHGPQILAAAGVLEGRKLTAYPAIRPEVEKAGAEWVEPNKTFSNASIDGNLTSAPAWPGHPELLRSFLEMLGTKITDEGIEAGGLNPPMASRASR